jgi:hypothetical protein
MRDRLPRVCRRDRVIFLHATGDVILKVDGTDTPSVDAFQKAADAASKNTAAVLRVKTSTGTRFVVVKP